MTRKKLTQLLSVAVLSATVAATMNTGLVNAASRDTKDIKSDPALEMEASNITTESEAVDVTDSIDSSISSDSSDSIEASATKDAEAKASTKLSPSDDIVGDITKGHWEKTENGKWRYYNKDGSMVTGMHISSPSVIFYFYQNGDSAEGWTEINGKMYYFKPAEQGYVMAINETIDGYYLDRDGVRQENDSTVKRGWQQSEDGLWYCYTNSGELEKGIYYANPFETYLLDYKTGASLSGDQEICGRMYYFKPAEHGFVMAKDETINGFYYDRNGVREDSLVQERTGWFLAENGSWYYYNDSHIAKNGFCTIDGEKYFFDYQTGASLSGWQEIKGKFYYFKPSEHGCVMAKNEIVDGYYVDSLGQRTEKKN